MRYKFVEALANELYLKALIGRFDDADYRRPSIEATRFMREQYGASAPVSLLRHEGHQPESAFIILDLSKGSGGAIFVFGGNADADVKSAPATL